MPYQLKSPAFAAGERIPARHTCEGDDISPALEWSGVPAGTQELALICDDPDAPRAEPFVHWVAYGISGSTTSLPENTGRGPRAPVKQGKNDFGKLGYDGPAP